jgi:hypothetical protein
MRTISPSVPATNAGPAPRRSRFGRVSWLLIGIGASVALTAGFGSLIISAGSDGYGGGGPLVALPTRTVTIAAPVASLNVESYGANITVTGKPVSQVTVKESISYDPTQGGPPAVTDTDAHGLLTLAAPACENANCNVGFNVTVPSGVTVNAEGDGGSVTVSGTGAADVDSGGGPVVATGISGPLNATAEGGNVWASGATAASIDSGGGSVTVGRVPGSVTVHTEGGGISVTSAGATDADSGGGPVTATGINGPLLVTAEGGGVIVTSAPGANIDSGGGPVTATRINGPLTISAEGGGVDVDGVSGTLNVNTGGGPLNASGVTSATVTADSENGTVTLDFTAVPTSLMVTTGGGNAALSVPNAPYALTLDLAGGPESVAIASSPGAANTINVNTGGGGLQIGPA